MKVSDLLLKSFQAVDTLSEIVYLAYVLSDTSDIYQKEGNFAELTVELYEDAITSAGTLRLLSKILINLAKERRKPYSNPDEPPEVLN